MYCTIRCELLSHPFLVCNIVSNILNYIPLERKIIYILPLATVLLNKKENCNAHNTPRTHTHKGTGLGGLSGRWINGWNCLEEWLRDGKKEAEGGGGKI